MDNWSKSSKHNFQRNEDTISKYKIELTFSHKKHLLVEGKTDKLLFKHLLNEIINNKKCTINKDSIFIDIAERFNDMPANNRERVEIICKKFENEFFAPNIVGFVDREFREFDICEYIQDKLSEHKVEGRLVWSRGHSIENYFFDFSILHESLTILSPTEWLDDALNLFKTLIHSTLRLACTASITANELGYTDLIKGSIQWHFLEFSESNLIFNYEDWHKHIAELRGFNSEKADKIVTRFKYWYQIINEADFSVVRWMCHGHIGIAFIWAAFSLCVYEKCYQSLLEQAVNQKNINYENLQKQAKKEATKVQQINEDNRCHACGRYWTQKVLVNQCDYPIEVIKLLGIYFS